MIKYILFGFVIAAIIFSPDDTKKLFNAGVDAVHGSYVALSKEIDKQPEYQAGEQNAKPAEKSAKPKTLEEQVADAEKRKQAAIDAAHAADDQLKDLEQQRIKTILGK